MNTVSTLVSGFGVRPALGLVQTRSLGGVTCGSEPVGMTCTDADTGHFSRASRESHQSG